MNFFQRRKILNKINALDLIPVKCVDSSIIENARINLLVPRFKRQYMVKIFISPKKSSTYNIRLDETGSLIWKIIDNKKNINEIYNDLVSKYKKENIQSENGENRIIKFFIQLYNQELITFKQFMEYGGVHQE
jgi:hypothetical protein